MKDCSKSMPFREDLKRPDLKVISGDFQCPVCKKSFCHSSSLSRHKMQAHFQAYTCLLCSQVIRATPSDGVTRKKVTAHDQLKKHMSDDHSIARFFLCRCCNSAFKDKTSLHTHMEAMKQNKLGDAEIIATSTVDEKLLEAGGDADFGVDSLGSPGSSSQEPNYQETPENSPESTDGLPNSHSIFPPYGFLDSLIPAFSGLPRFDINSAVLRNTLESSEFALKLAREFGGKSNVDVTNGENDNEAKDKTVNKADNDGAESASAVVVLNDIDRNVNGCKQQTTTNWTSFATNGNGSTHKGKFLEDLLEKRCSVGNRRKRTKPVHHPQTEKKPRASEDLSASSNKSESKPGVQNSVTKTTEDSRTDDANEIKGFITDVVDQLIMNTNAITEDKCLLRPLAVAESVRKGSLEPESIGVCSGCKELMTRVEVLERQYDRLSSSNSNFQKMLMMSMCSYPVNNV